MSTAAPESAVEPLTTVVARRVRGLRAELGLRQADLGRALGMSTASVSERLRGDTKFDINELPALAGVLGTTIEYLLGLTDVRRAPSTFADEALEGVVRHQGLEPRTRWFSVSPALTVVPQEPSRVADDVPAGVPVAATVEPRNDEPLATVLPFHRPARARLLGGSPRPRPTRPTTERAS